MRSNVTRRISVSRSASGAGFRSFDSSVASTKRSISLRPHAGRAHGGQRRTRRRDERPVRLPLGALFDPADEDGLLDLIECQVRVGRRHHHLGVGAGDAADQFAAAGPAGDDGAAAGGEIAEGAVLLIEAEAGFADAVVRTVALEAAVREDRADVEVEIDALRHAGDEGRPRAAAARAHRRPRRDPRQRAGQQQRLNRRRP